MKKILVVGGGAYQVPLIKRIIESGFKAYCVDGNLNALGFKCATGYKHINVLDKNACLEYAKELGIDAVMTYGATLTLPTVAYIGEKLGLPALPIDTAELSKSKYKIKKRLADYGCNIKGDFFEMYSVEDAKNHKFTFPCVIKPSDGSGSKGVSLVYNENEIENAVRRVIIDINNKFRTNIKLQRVDQHEDGCAGYILGRVSFCTCFHPQISCGM